jgi:hypothetical protein
MWFVIYFLIATDLRLIRGWIGSEIGDLVPYFEHLYMVS